MRFLLAMILVLSSCVGDAPGPDDPGNRHSDLASTRPIDPNRLVEDSDLEGGQTITVAQIQALLVDQHSALAGYSEGGRSAAQWIVDQSTAQHISPLYMVARIETESSLIRSGTLSKLHQATGCACPDGAACDPAVAGFGLQVRCAAELIRGYLADLDAHGSTITGWSVGVGRSTSDPCWVVPQNRATAALYTYTPWVGAYAAGCGTSQWGGSSLVALLVRYFADALPDAGAQSCPQGNGLYCGGNGVAGSAGTLYRCDATGLTVVTVCSAGCFPQPPGHDDVCVTPDQPCSQGNGLYCGGNGIAGDADTLYQCRNGTVTVSSACADGCERHANGIDDACR